MATSARLRSRFDFILFGLCVLGALIPLGVPNARDGIASALRRTIVMPLVSLQSGAERWRNAWLRREGDMMAADSLALRLSNARALEIENGQLRRLMGLGRRLEWGFIPAEALQGAVEQDFVTSIVLTAGSNAGVRRYSAVVAPEGLVGKVETVEPTMSIAILYTDEDFAASAMSADGSAFGLVYPHLGEGRRANDRQYLLELRGVPWRSELKPGTPIRTSGLGLFPAGIPIGTILRQTDTVAGLSRTYLVTPAVDPSKITAVFILFPQRATQGIGNVWTSAVAADSMTRRIVAAGDSVERRAQALEAQARLAALDSAVRFTRDSMRSALGLPLDGSADSLARVNPGAAVGGIRPPGAVAPRPNAVPPTGVRRDSLRPDTTRRVPPPDTGSANRIRPPRS